MVRYILSALALKAFSVNAITKNAYRTIGNSFGKNKSKKAKLGTYIKRGDLLLDLCEKHNAIKEGGNVLEIGTGWFHWYSLYLRMFHDVNITMFDVWDNRQFGGMQNLFARLKEDMEADTLIPEAVKENIDILLGVHGFDELYRKLKTTSKE